MTDEAEKAYEAAAAIADKADWLRCSSCGAVKNDYYPADCAYLAVWMETEKAKSMVFLDGSYAAHRYFEKYVCRHEQLGLHEIGPAIAEAIRAAALPRQPEKEGA